MDTELALDRLSGIGDVDPPREIEVKLKNGVAGTIAIPHSVDNENLDKYASPTNRIAILLHGQAGHRDYCYQKQLAHKLAAELGVYSLRIDFRGCGSSDDYADAKKGRVLELDVEDIDACVQFVLSKELNPLNISFDIMALIGHSRGCVAMFLWAMNQDNLYQLGDKSAVVVPNLINCSSRFTSATVMDRYPIGDEAIEYLEQTALRHGSYQPTKVPMTELESLATADLTPLRKLSMNWSVLSIYGLEDNIIPKEDGARFANHLNRGPYSHHFEVVPGADHNFFGVEQIDHDGDAEEFNPLNLPLNKKNLVNYNYFVSAFIIKYLRPDQELLRFYHATKFTDAISRWKSVDGISNFRDLGNWVIQNPRYPQKTGPTERTLVRPGLIYRCANTNDITENGVKALQQLNIRKVFDLRSAVECQVNGTPEGLANAGIERVYNPVFEQQDASPQGLVQSMGNLLSHWDSFVHAYDDMLENGHNLFKKMFEHIRDHPDQPFVFHCTAGKDRTGMFAMLLLLFLGVEKHIVAREYELTSQGLKPDFAKIRESFKKALGKLEGREKIEEALARGRKDYKLDQQGFDNVLSSRYEAMIATLDMVDEKYGGVVTYMKDKLGFNEKDLEKIYDHSTIRVPIGGTVAKF